MWLVQVGDHINHREVQVELEESSVSEIQVTGQVELEESSVREIQVALEDSSVKSGQVWELKFHRGTPPFRSDQ